MLEQGSLCAYTMLHISQQTSHIEHVNAQSTHQALSIDYKNMAACYPAGGCEFGAQKRGNTPLPLTPYQENISDHFSYLPDGTIVGKSTEARSTIEILDLNHHFLKNCRRVAYLGFVSKIKTLSPSQMERLLHSYQKEEVVLPQFCAMFEHATHTKHL